MTRSQQLSIAETSRWRLVSHLTANSLGVLFDQDDPSRLQSWLALYDHEHGQSSEVIKGITKLSCRHAHKRCAAIGHAFYQGTQIDIEFDRTKYSGSHLFLFGLVLDRFFARLANLNSFTQLNLHTQQQGLLCACPARSGEQVLF